MLRGREFRLKSFRNSLVPATVLLSILLLASQPISVLALSFGPVRDISNDDDNSDSPDIAVDGENVFAVWTDTTSNPNSVLLKMSIDGGDTFTGPELVSDGIHDSAHPQVFAVGNTVYVAWVTQGVGNGDIYLRKGTVSSGVLSFKNEQNISNSPDLSDNPRIAVADGNMFILWEENVSTYNEIFYAASPDDGDTFVSNNLSNSSITVSDNVDVVASGNNAFITWDEADSNTFLTDAYFIKATITGNTVSFSGLTNLSVNLGSQANVPKIAVDGNNVYIVWDDNNFFDIFYAASFDGGGSFDIPADNADNNLSNNANSGFPDVFAASDEVYFVWINFDGDVDTYFTKGTVSGGILSLDGAIDIDGEPETSSHPSVTAFGTNVYVTWYWDNFPSEVFVSTSLDGGSTFATVNLSNNDGNSASSKVAASADKAFVVWNDDVSGDSDVLLRTVQESGPPSIAIESVSDSTPKWDDSISINGLVNGNGTDTISIDWGDGNVDPGNAVDGSTWGPYYHTYDSANTGSKQIVVTLFNDTGTEMASDTKDITVQKHATSITMDPIFSVVEGNDISVAGTLMDTDGSTAIEGVDITFDGNGATNLGTAATLADGSFSVTGASPSSIGDLWAVQAHFTGNTAFDASDSEIGDYDTVAIGTAAFDVPAGSPSGPIDLTGFGASIVFDNVLSDGSIFVSTCDSPASSRYEPMTDDLCVKISPAVELGSDFAANLTVTFDENKMATGHTVDDIDLFHEGISGITDITAARDSGAVTGTITSFSKFIVGASVHSNAPTGASRQQVFVGNNDLLFNFTITKDIALDASEYSVGDTVTLNVTDPSENLDDLSIETIEATANSTSDSTGITVDLVETGVNTGIFVGTFTLVSGTSSTADAELHVESGDDIGAFYEEYTKAPFHVIIDDVDEAGLAQLTDLVSRRNDTNFVPVGDGYEMSFIDAGLGDNANLTITMSYFNVKGLTPSEEHELDMFRMDGQICKERLNSPGEGIDTDEMTITGNTTKLGQYTLALVRDNPPGQCPEPGGSGGGLARPGTGIVLDASASIAAGSSDNNSVKGGSHGRHRVEVVMNQPSLLSAPIIDIHPESYFDDHPLEKIQVVYAGFHDAVGNNISHASAGQHVIIASSFSNHQQKSQHYSFIAEIIDENGIAIYIEWQQGTIESGQTANLSLPWMPQDSGNYTARLFVWDGMDHPLPLSDVTTHSINVL